MSASSILRRLAGALALGGLLAAGALAAPAQRPTSVTAQLSTGIVKLGQEVRLSIVAENVQQAAVEALPSVDGLRFSKPQGPNTQTMMTIQNGRRTVSQTLTWVVGVQPERKGDFRIPSFTVLADGQRIATRELALKVVEDLQGEELGFFEIDAPGQVAEGQPFTLELRFGWDAALDNRLNYANLSLPWLGALAGVVELDAPVLARNASTVELNLNSRERVQAERLPDKAEGGRTFHILSLKRRYLATRAGKIEIPTSHLEFGSVDESGSFFDLRPRREKETYYKRFPAFAIEVVELPEQGRPLDFTGAVGQIAVQAGADRRDVDAGESIKLTVEWTGDANLEFFEPPDPRHLEAFKGFRVYGSTDRKTWERRQVVYDLAPLSADVSAIPPLPLRVYDPARKAYTTVQTQAIPIHVRALANASGLGAELAAPATTIDIRDIQAVPVLASASTRSSGWLAWAAGACVLAAWLALRTLVRRRGDPASPLRRARRAAFKNLTRELETARSASAQSRALERFLAARSGEPANAWLGRDVRAWAAGVPGRLSPAAAEELARINAALDESNWARSDQALDPRLVRAAAESVMQGGL